MPIPGLAGVPVLVTGGAGFIGSHLVDALVERGAKVRVLDNFSTGRRENLRHGIGRIDLVENDIRDLDACRKACHGVELVFHEAALGSVPRSMKDPATTMAINVTGTANVFTAARDAGARRIVYASSSSVYGDSEALPKREGQEGRPLSPYALSKVMDEQLATVFVSCYGLDIVGLRYFNVFGPRQDPSGPYAAVIPKWLTAVASGQAPVIFGDGEQSRDFTYVTDAVRANLLAAGAPATVSGRVFNIAGGARTTLLSLAQLLGEVTGRRCTPVHQPLRKGDIPHSFADLTLASRHLEYVPGCSLANGLKECLSPYLSES
ncbi:MAG: SDR family oxidoreductase [Thermoanaerobaculia bacterium]